MKPCIEVILPSNEIDVLLGAECDSTTVDIHLPSNEIDIFIERPVEGERGTQGPPGAPGESYAESFESVSKNIRSWDYSLTYDAGLLVAITYTSGALEIVKTLAYDAGLLSSITLSGDTPSGISLTKTLGYTSGTLTSISYS